MLYDHEQIKNVTKTTTVQKCLHFDLQPKYRQL
jgi:hypothetical protein